MRLFNGVRRRAERPAIRCQRAAGPALLILAALATAGCSLSPHWADEERDQAPTGPLPIPPALQVQGAPPVPAARLWALKRFSQVAGHGFVAWHPLRAEMLVTHPAGSTLQLFRVGGARALPEQLTFGNDPVRVATWEPREGRYLVFARGDGGNEAFQLYRMDAGIARAVPIMPRGQRHIPHGWLTSRSQLFVTSLPLDRHCRGGNCEEAGDGTVRTTLSLVDPLQPEARQVLAELPGGGWGGILASPDERRLVLRRSRSSAESELWLMDLATRQRTRLLPAAAAAAGGSRRAAFEPMEWSLDGQSLFLISDQDGEHDALMRLDLASGKLASLGNAPPWDVEAVGRSADGRCLALRVNVDGRDELHLLAADGGPAAADCRTPEPPPGSVQRLAFHPKLPLLATVWSGARGPAQVQVLDLTQRRFEAWTRPFVPHGLDLNALPEPERVRWTSFDGRVISGILHRPPARFAGRRPVLVQVHGGPAAQAKLGWPGRLVHLTQDLGIAVLEPNVRGSSGYGKSFLALDDGLRREDSVKDLGAALDWIASDARLDPARVVVSGGSYGGYMALAAAVHYADRIAGAVSVVGISHFVSFLERTESYRRDLRRAEYGDERDPAMREFLHRVSPLTQASRMRRPMLVAHGRNDPRVPYTESERIVARLDERGVPVWYLLADNEGHGFVRRENADYLFATLSMFLEQTLLRP